MPSALTLELLGAFLLGSIYIFFFNVRRGPPLPPGKHSPAAGCPNRVDDIIGPPTLPIIGNLHQLPRSGAHFQYYKTSCTGAIHFANQTDPDSQNGPRNMAP